MTSDELTPREREILDLAQGGLTNDDIAAQLGITRNAVRYHLKELHSKLETGGSREGLRLWRRLRAFLPAIPPFTGSTVANVTAATAAGFLALASVAVVVTWSATHDGQADGDVAAVDGRYPNGCPDRYAAWQETDLEGFAAEYHEALGSYDELAALNPEAAVGTFPPGTEILVAYNPNAECAEAVATPPAP
jgi:DNA-binding CsgD family transcriptional regulator